MNTLPLGRPEMLAVELHALDAAVLVHLETIGELHAGTAAQLRVFGGPSHIAKGDRLDGIVRAFGNLELHFQVLAADDPGVEDLEITVEHGLRKALPPGAGAAQHARSVEAELGSRERAVRMNYAGERFVVAARGDLGRESGAERRQFSLRQAYARRHGVAAKFVDETGVMGRDAVEGIANIDARDRARRAPQG